MTSTEPDPGPRPAPDDDGGWVGTFVRRPVLTVVVNLLIIVAGIAALQGIEVRELPDVDRPVVTVSASYEGATPQTMDAQITSTHRRRGLAGPRRQQHLVEFIVWLEPGHDRIHGRDETRRGRNGRPRRRRRHPQPLAEGPEATSRAS